MAVQNVFSLNFWFVKEKEYRRKFLPCFLHKKNRGVIFNSGIASESLKGRVYEVSLGDLNNAEAEFRKMRLICEDVQGRTCLTNFHGMRLSRDKLCSIVKKWHVSGSYQEISNLFSVLRLHNSFL